jgi:hypothetical protein
MKRKEARRGGGGEGEWKLSQYFCFHSALSFQTLPYPEGVTERRGKWVMLDRGYAAIHHNETFTNGKFFSSLHPRLRPFRMFRLLFGHGIVSLYSPPKASALRFSGQE